jgi:hypothetical protein
MLLLYCTTIRTQIYVVIDYKRALGARRKGTGLKNQRVYRLEIQSVMLVMWSLHMLKLLSCTLSIISMHQPLSLIPGQLSLSFNLNSTCETLITSISTSLGLKKLFKKLPLYSLPSTWNDLGDLRFQPNKFTFRTSLNDFLQPLPPVLPSLA